MKLSKSINYIADNFLRGEPASIFGRREEDEMPALWLIMDNSFEFYINTLKCPHFLIYLVNIFIHTADKCE